MEKANITITTVHNIKYNANHISIETKMIDNKVTSMISFLCNESKIMLVASRIKSIECSVNSVQSCSECNQILKEETK